MTVDEMSMLLNREPVERWCGMCIEKIHLLPDVVSFSHVIITEGYCDATNKKGIFENDVVLGHSVAAGAGRVIQIKCDNCIDGADYAGYSGLYWEPGNSGSFCWWIPCYWATMTEPLTRGRRLKDRVLEMFSIRANGDFSVKKFGHKIIRDINGITR